MILSTDGLVPLANANNIVAGTTRKFMMMFDGAMPSVEDFKAAMFSNVVGTGFMEGTIRGLYRLSSFTAWAQARGNTLRAWCLYNQALNAFHVGPTKFTFPLGERPEEFTKVAAGPVTWFMFCTVATNAVDPTTSSPMYFVGIGSIGGVGTESDLILLDSAVSLDQVLKSDDLVFNYTWS